MKTLRIADDFSRFPAGRLRVDGPRSGEAFREDVLAPALRDGPVCVQLDGTMGFGSSFLKEAFGGLVQSGDFTRAYLERNLTVEASHDSSLVTEIWEYVRRPERRA